MVIEELCLGDPCLAVWIRKFNYSIFIELNYVKNFQMRLGKACTLWEVHRCDKKRYSIEEARWKYNITMFIKERKSTGYDMLCGKYTGVK